MLRRTIRQAFVKSLPVMAGYLVLGIGFGILLRNAGYGVLWAVAMSLLIYAGSMQYVGMGLLTGGVFVLMTALTTFMVNARHLFYSISMIDRYRDAGRLKPCLIFGLTDETYSLLCDGQTPPDADPNLFRFLVTLFNHCYWVAGSILGSLLGAVLPFSTEGIEFSMTALFVASFTEQWLNAKDHLPALTGLLRTLLCLLVFGPERFLIPAMLLITLVLTLLRGREERRRYDETAPVLMRSCPLVTILLRFLPFLVFRQRRRLMCRIWARCCRRHHRHAGDLLPEGREHSARPVRPSGADRGRLRVGPAGVEAQLPPQHSGGDGGLYGADPPALKKAGSEPMEGPTR